MASVKLEDQSIPEFVLQREQRQTQVKYFKCEQSSLGSPSRVYACILVIKGLYLHICVISLNVHLHILHENARIYA